MSTDRIPSETEFSSAHAAMKERDRGLSEVRSNILKRFQSAGLHEAFIFYSPAADIFAAYLFYCREGQVQEAHKSGLSSRIEQAIIEELKHVGRGCRDAMKIDFGFDSHENVKRNFGGDYFRRLR